MPLLGAEAQALDRAGDIVAHDRQLQPRRVDREPLAGHVAGRKAILSAPAGRARRTQAVRLRRRVARHRAARRVEALLRLAAPVPDWRDQRSLSGFGAGEWFELAEKMFDFTGDNVFVIGTVGEAQHPAHQQRPAQRPHRVPGLQHRLERQPDVLGRPTLARPLTDGTRCHWTATRIIPYFTPARRRPRMTRGTTCSYTAL